MPGQIKYCGLIRELLQRKPTLALIDIVKEKRTPGFCTTTMVWKTPPTRILSNNPTSDDKIEMKLMYFKSCHTYGGSITPYATGIANAQTKPTNSPKSARSKFVAR